MNFTNKLCKSALIYTALSGLALPAAHAAITQKAVVATVAPDYSAGAHSAIDVAAPHSASNSLLPSGSDMAIDANGKYFYRMERSGAHNITKFSSDAPATPIWQYSVNGADAAANPYDLIFATPTKAYLLRYGSSTAWIVNPAAGSEADFKIGEIDLSAYSDADGVPEMARGIIANNKLFILMQRLEFWTQVRTPYMAVIDTTTDTEIDAGIANDENLKGIPLPLKNPLAIDYLAASDTIYIQGTGGWGAVGESGIATVDPTTYSATLLVDDDVVGFNISGMSIVSPTVGYLVGYAGWGDNSLYSFDPSNGILGSTIDADLNNINISGLQGGSAVDNSGTVWICDATNHQLILLDSASNTIMDKIDTELNPSSLAFTSTGTAWTATVEASNPIDVDAGGITQSALTVSVNDVNSEINGATVTIDSGITITDENGDPILDATPIAVSVVDDIGDIDTAPGMAGSAVEFGPSGTQFSAPAAITLPYTNNVDPDSLNIYWYNPAVQEWQIVETGRSVDSINGTISVTTTHFSLYAPGTGSSYTTGGGAAASGGCLLKALR